VPILMIMIFSQKFTLLIPFTAYFVGIAVLLIIGERLGSHTEIQESKIVQSYFFHKSIIPIAKVITSVRLISEQIHLVRRR
jgi:hypothetical protein